MSTVLVTGATGTVGRHIVAGLHDAGAEVLALTRDPARAGGCPPRWCAATWPTPKRWPRPWPASTPCT
ncbi:NAD-dependent epimerase/dehydratase family protein [Dactylosporangium sp. NPDC051541]|uniref:NmrA family NAD(P)-binding protein n=1 Tax=Dactylosporangium sp. NPDC051541 TaxID=3363977 RepID=UPI0037907981